jgi:hypothetical protein
MFRAGRPESPSLAVSPASPGLVVDELLQSVRDYLRRFRFDAVAGRECGAVARGRDAGGIDVVILDVILLDADGLALPGALREKSLPDCSSIAVGVPLRPARGRRRVRPAPAAASAARAGARRVEAPTASRPAS